MRGIFLGLNQQISYKKKARINGLINFGEFIFWRILLPKL